MKRILFSTLSLIFGILCLSAQLSLPAIISDGMVLQQNAKAVLWGKATPNSWVAITSSWEKTTKVQADENGRWRTKIKTPKSATEQTLTFKTEKEKITVNHILIGEVWLCSGQSNMEYTVGKQGDWRTGMLSFDKDIKDADYPYIHLFQVDKTFSFDGPRDDCKGHWMVCNTDNIYNFSAIAFLFGREMYKHLNCPMGIIESSWGGSHAESWTKPEVMKGNPLYTKVIERFTYENMKKNQWFHKIPGMLWNSIIEPILGYTVKGNIWYQGESNAPRHEQYQEVFTNMIDSWRKEWGQRLPFYYVMAAPHSTQNGWLREAQLRTWTDGKVKDIGLSTVIDAGDSLDLHPRDKVKPAKRLTAWALAKEYKKDIPYLGPIFKSYKIEGNCIRIKFDHAEGLYKQGNVVNDLWIAGEDKIFHKATAWFDGNTISVSAKEVPHPVAVRYCYSNYCKGNIYNKYDIPAYPFRTDNW